MGEVMTTGREDRILEDAQDNAEMLLRFCRKHLSPSAILEALPIAIGTMFYGEKFTEDQKRTSMRAMMSLVVSIQDGEDVDLVAARMVLGGRRCRLCGHPILPEHGFVYLAEESEFSHYDCHEVGP